MIQYSELHCYSNFTFLKGASHPEELVAQAAKLGYQAIAITDECSLAGVVRAHVEAKKHRIKLLIGSELKTVEQLQLIIIAPHRIAYGQLSTLITKARRRSPKGEYQVSLQDINKTLKDCLCIWLPNAQQCSNPKAAQWTCAFEKRIWIGIENTLDGQQDLSCKREQLAYQLQIPTVACGHVHMHDKNRKPLQDVITAIRLNQSVHEAGFEIHSNRERHLRPLDIIATLYHPDQITQTQLIARKCQFSLDELRYEYPQELVPPGFSATGYLRYLVEAGIKIRWPNGAKKETLNLIDKELKLIQELQYEYYFLTVYDIVQFARSQGILCQGRGSAANSAVCFCLLITEVDPEKTSVLFERFISKERNEPPDIDVDFEHERREEVIQFIYRKYGRHRAALAATVVTYRLKSAVRDVGKALGFDQTLIDQLSKAIAWWDKQQQLEEHLKTLGVDCTNPYIMQFRQLVNQLLGFPRHLSQHVGGFIISAAPLDQLVPVENAAMPERTIVQWDKDDIEALGLLKIDVLALGMLSAIRKTFNYIKNLRGIEWTMATLPPEDPATYQMLQQGDSIGVFQVESRAQMSMLPRLKPKCFYDLVVEVAIVRPGPIQGNMVHPYLKRRNGTEPVTYPNPEIKKVLERTLGVPIFQEQVIQLAMVAAGFSAGEADQLRRAMASWRKKGELRQYQDKLTAGLLARGHSQEFANQIIEQINGFGEYGFPESHAASFALLVYVSAWLKCHEPAAFCCALLNSQPMGFYTPSQLIQDIRRHHVEVRAVDVRCSDWDHHLETSSSTSQQNTLTPTPSTPYPQPAIRLGLRLIKGLSFQGGQRLIMARQQAPFESVADLKARAHLNQKDMEALAHANALSGLCGHRHQAHWEALSPDQNSPLIQHQHLRETKVQLPPPSEGKDTSADYQSLGLTLGRHPLAILRTHPKLKGCKTHQQLYSLTHKRFVRIAGIVTGRQRPGSASGALFLTLEDETGNSNVIIWKDLLEREKATILQSRLLLIKGVIEREESVLHIIAGALEDLTPLLGLLSTQSRDFR